MHNFKMKQCLCTLCSHSLAYNHNCVWGISVFSDRDDHLVLSAKPSALTSRTIFFHSTFVSNENIRKRHGAR